jgi:hypothetical protein
MRNIAVLLVLLFATIASANNQEDCTPCTTWSQVKSCYSETPDACCTCIKTPTMEYGNGEYNPCEPCSSIGEVFSCFGPDPAPCCSCLWDLFVMMDNSVTSRDAPVIVARAGSRLYLPEVGEASVVVRSRASLAVPNQDTAAISDDAAPVVPPGVCDVLAGPNGQQVRVATLLGYL